MGNAPHEGGLLCGGMGVGVVRELIVRADRQILEKKTSLFWFGASKTECLLDWALGLGSSNLHMPKP